MNHNAKFLLFIFCICLSCTQISAQNGQPTTGAAAATTSSPMPGDPRVASALNQTKTDFQFDSRDGTYTVTYGTKEKRAQKVLIASDTEKINGVEMRLIFSFAFMSQQPLSQQTANLLLQENAVRTGVWTIHKLSDGKYAVVNQLYVPADFGGENLDLALQAVAVLADEMEERFAKKDEN